MWALVIFTVAANGASTVATLDFATQNFCLLAEQKLKSLTEPVVLEGLVRYEVVATCVQVKEEEDAKKKKIIPLNRTRGLWNAPHRPC